MSVKEVDLAIIGGGPAGMSAALIAGRARLRTVVINAEEPRNGVTTASHGLFTRDGAHPLELLAAAKQDLGKYATVRYVRGRVESVAREQGRTVLRVDGQSISAHRVIIATGFRDELERLELPGIVEAYGKSVFPCPFCDGFEHRDQRVAVLGGAAAEHMAPVVRIWSPDVVVFTNGRGPSEGLSQEAEQTLRRRGVEVVRDRVVQLVSDGGILQAIELADGRRIERDVGFLGDDCSVPATNFPEALGVGKTTNDWGMEVYAASDTGKTEVPGVYVVGDAKSGFGGLVAAAHEGTACVEGIVHEIATERWSQAEPET